MDSKDWIKGEEVIKVEKGRFISIFGKTNTIL